jgi:purine-nucleoside phosphorylase
MPTSDFDRIAEAAAFIGGLVPVFPPVALVLGTGLGDVVSSLEGPCSIPYQRIPHWPAPAVAGHDGRLLVGTLSGRPVAVLSGRAHRYEGWSGREIAMPPRTLAALGVKTLILTNAAGGVNPGFPAGTLMLIEDHVNLTGDNPLIGPNDERIGSRFPDMSDVYSARLRGLASEAAGDLGLALAPGVYAGLSGPSYETPAEVRFLRTIGADAVGMSTVPEAIAARHAGMEVLALSVITNAAADVHSQGLSHLQTIEQARQASARLSALLREIVIRL